MNIKITIPGEIIPKQSARFRIMHKKGALLKVNGITYLDRSKCFIQSYQPTKVTKYAALVARTAREQYKGPLLEGPLLMMITVYLKRPGNHFRTNGEFSKAGREAGRWCEKNKDFDNIAKNILDPLHGIIFANDKQVTFGSVKKYWNDGRGERVEIIISKLD